MNIHAIGAGAGLDRICAAGDRAAGVAYSSISGLDFYCDTG